jgi:hypothetical protein
MQSFSRVPHFTIKNIEPIKIRKVRVSSRKIKQNYQNIEKTSSTECPSSTQMSHRSGSSQSVNRGNFHSSLGKSISSSTFGAFQGIKEIKENPEVEEDSVILELNELLSQIPKDSSKGGKKPFVSLKMKLKEKIVSAKTERNISGASGRKLILN